MNADARIPARVDFRSTEGDRAAIVFVHGFGLWLVEERQADRERARAMYEEGVRLAVAAGGHGQVFHTAINVAFLDLMQAPPGSAVPDRVKAMARQALVGEQGVERLRAAFGIKVG